MKKLFLALTVTLVLSAAPVMAESVVDSFAKPGDLSAQLGVGLTFYGLGIGYSLNPGAEFGLTQVKFSDQFPINFGVSGRGYYSSYSYTYSGSSDTVGWNYMGIGAFGTAHYSLKYLKLGGDFWNHIDYYAGLGLGFASEGPFGTWVDNWKKAYPNDHTWDSVLWFGLVGYSGASYHLNDHWSVFVEYASFAYSGGTVIGASYKF